MDVDGWRQIGARPPATISVMVSQITDNSTVRTVCLTSQKTSKSWLLSLYEGNPPVTGGFPSQRNQQCGKPVHYLPSWVSSLLAATSFHSDNVVFVCRQISIFDGVSVLWKHSYGQATKADICYIAINANLELIKILEYHEAPRVNCHLDSLFYLNIFVSLLCSNTHYC